MTDAIGIVWSSGHITTIDNVVLNSEVDESLDHENDPFSLFIGDDGHVAPQTTLQDDSMRPSMETMLDPTNPIESMNQDSVLLSDTPTWPISGNGAEATANSMLHPLLSSPPYIFSWTSAQDFLCIPELNLSERRALDYYRNMYSPSRSLKGFSWSVYSIFLCTAVKQEVVLHFILALSLRDLVRLDNSNTGDDLSSRTHLNKGVELLGHTLKSCAHDHISVLMSFWLLMLVTLNCEMAPSFCIQRRWLSRTLASYVRMHGLHKYGDTTSVNNGDTGSGAAAHALIAKLVYLLIVGDIQFDFRSYAGHLAELLDEDTNKLQDLDRQSQDCLQLHHGQGYPLSELLHDVEGAECHRIYASLHWLYHNLDKLFWRGSGDYSALEEKIVALEKVGTVHDLSFTA